MTLPTAGQFDEHSPESPVVRVTTLDSEESIEVPFKEPHRAVQHYLEVAGVTTNRRQAVTLNGAGLGLWGKKFTMVTTPGSAIVVSSRVKNG